MQAGRGIDVHVEGMIMPLDLRTLVEVADQLGFAHPPYVRINNKIGIPFGENVVKSLASGVATNLASYVAVSGVASALKLIPGFGTVAGAIVMTAASYAATLASGWLYLQALTIAAQKKGGSFTMDDISKAMKSLFQDKKAISDFVDAAKKDYKK